MASRGGMVTPFEATDQDHARSEGDCSMSALTDPYLIRCRLFCALGIPAKHAPILHVWSIVEGRRFGHELTADLLCRRGSAGAVRNAVRRELNALGRFLCTFPYYLGYITRGGRHKQNEVTHYGSFAINRAVTWIQEQAAVDPDSANPIVTIDRYVSEAITRHIPKNKPPAETKKNKKPAEGRRRGNHRLKSGYTFDRIKFLAELPPDSTFHDALKFADFGFKLFAVWGVTDSGICRCRKAAACDKPGKHPIPSHWRQIATDYIPTLAKFAQRHPYANYGIACGVKMAGGLYLTVIDVDERHFGHGTLAALERCELGALPRTREHSAGGGPHKFYLHPRAFHSSPGALGQGIDVQSYGKFVICAGLNARGKRYGVTVDELIARLPDTWAERIDAVRRKALPLVPEGQRRAALFRWAGGMVADNMDRDLILRVLQDRREKRLEKGSHSFSDDELTQMIDYCIRQENGKRNSEQRARVA